MTVYCLAGFPRTGLHAGGLQYLIETVEGLAILEHDPAVQYRKEGKFFVTDTGTEQVSDKLLHLSDMVIQTGITENWFDDNACFGNGVVVAKTTANYKTKIVNHSCGRTLEEIVKSDGVADFSQLRMVEAHDFTEGWAKYEARWRSNTCLQENHAVHLTIMSTKHELSPSSYERIRSIVEEGAEPKHPEAYVVIGEPGKYFSEIRKFVAK